VNDTATPAELESARAIHARRRRAATLEAQRVETDPEYQAHLTAADAALDAGDGATFRSEYEQAGRRVNALLSGVGA
jgi:uncharacterized membrane-anchored protein